MSIAEYNAAQLANLRASRRLQHLWDLVTLLDNLYIKSTNLVPPDSPSRYGRFLLLCHKHLVSAASLIFQGQSDDAAPITRRAIEIARVSLASKVDAKNVKKWLSYEKRQDRWKARQAGKKPPWLPPIQYDLPLDHPILSKLKTTEGVLSDGYVHFTPEYFANQNWSYDHAEDGSVSGIRLSCFVSGQANIEREVILLTGTHAKILKVFDECFDGAFSEDPIWKSTMEELQKKGWKVSQQIAKPKFRGIFQKPRT